MSEISINNLKNNTDIFTNIKNKTHNDTISVFQQKETINPDNKAKELGYKKTQFKNAYYNKQDKIYYKWNETSQIFQPTKLSDLTAEKKGYDKTNNPVVYCEKKTNTYYKWIDNKLIKLIYFKEMYENGSYKIGNNTVDLIYDTKNNCKYINYKTGEVEYHKANNGYLTEDEIIEFEANIIGYIETFQKGIYCDKDEKNFFTWDMNSKSFKPTTKPQIPNIELNKEKEVIIQESFINYDTQPLDGKFENFKQGEYGDCWLLSTIYAINNMGEYGKKLISEIIVPDHKGNVTINLKGAQKSYFITASEIKKAIDKNLYAKGDEDIIALELAFEKFRQENDKNNNTNINQFSPYFRQHWYNNEHLTGGTNYNAILLLTGKGATKLSRLINRDNTYNNNLTAFNNTIELKNFEETVENYLKEPNFIKLASMKVENGMGHSVVIVDYDEENIYVIDPNNTYQKPQPIKKSEFFEKISDITISDLKTEPDKILTNSNKRLQPIITPEAKKYIDKDKKER